MKREKYVAYNLGYEGKSLNFKINLYSELI